MAIHLWWARRPLVACRAAVYGVLVPAERFRPRNRPEGLPAPQASAPRQAGGRALDQETCEKLFNCRGSVTGEIDLPEGIRSRLAAEADRHGKATISMSLERNNKYFNEAREQLEKWADDMVLAAEEELRDTKEQIRALNRQARQATTIQEQRELQEKIRDLERKKRRQRQRIFDVEDEILEKRDKLIDALEKRMQQRTSSEQLFTIRWTVV